MTYRIRIEVVDVQPSGHETVVRSEATPADMTHGEAWRLFDRLRAAGDANAPGATDKFHA